MGAPETTAAFSVMSGLRFLYDRRQMYGLTLLQSDATSGLMSLYEDASVHITQGVPGTWIRAVDIYRWDERTRQRILVTTENNPRYRAPRGPPVCGVRLSVRMRRRCGGQLGPGGRSGVASLEQRRGRDLDAVSLAHEWLSVSFHRLAQPHLVVPVAR